MENPFQERNDKSPKIIEDMVTSRNLRRALSIILYFILGFYSGSKLYGQVKMYNQPLTLPAYGVMEPEIMPDWGEYHYPYTMLDRFTNV